MSKYPPTRAMREDPDIDQLKRQAKELLDAFRSGDAAAIQEVTAHFRDARPDTIALHDAQLALARSYGFDSWPKLKARVDGVTGHRLCDAVERGDLATARALLTRRPEIVDLGREETRALHFAVLRRDVEMTRLLLSFGADTQGGIWPNRDATSPYTLANERGFEDILALIREELARRGGLRPTAPSEAYRQLHYAFHASGEEAVVAVFEANPELAGVCPPDGLTMLHQMAGASSIRMVNWLLDHGAEVNRRSKEGWTALDFAASGRGANPTGFEQTARVLIHHGAELSPLSAAALGRQDYIAALPLADLQGKGLLGAAVRNQSVEMLRYLLALGLDPDERTQAGHPEEQTFSAGGPLMEAVNRGSLEMATALLDHGADPNAQVFTSGSPTFRAYERGNPEMIALMTKRGGWIDAASVGYLRLADIARKMLDGELDPHLEMGEFSGKTAAEQILWSGASGGSAEIVGMALPRIDWPRGDERWFWMLWRPLPGHEDLDLEQQARCIETFRLLLSRCDPNLQAPQHGQTMLHEVIARDHRVGAALATILLDAGARLDIRDRLLNSTPLGWACRWGRVEIVKLLLARGADPVESAAEPWATPRAWAEKMGHAEIARLLA